MYLGIDIGTSSVKALLLDEQRSDCRARLLSARMSAARSRDFSEQDPESWWRATVNAVGTLPAAARAAVRAVGLSGQMHGATLLDQEDRPLRPGDPLE